MEQNQFLSEPDDLLPIAALTGTNIPNRPHLPPRPMTFRQFVRREFLLRLDSMEYRASQLWARLLHHQLPLCRGRPPQAARPQAGLEDVQKVVTTSSTGLPRRSETPAGRSRFGWRPARDQVCPGCW
jgi:hypothetical protein